MIALILLAATALAQDAALYLPDATWAAEDVFDGSDADQNDAVLRYNVRCLIDSASGDLRREEIRFTPAAAGATKTNRLLLQFASSPEAVTLAVDGGAPTTLCSSTTACGSGITLYTDLRGAFEDPPVGFVNTDGAPDVRGREHLVVVDHPAGTPAGGSCPRPDFALDRDDLAAPIDRSATLPANGQPLVGDFSDYCPAASCTAEEFVPWAPPAERVSVADAYGEPFLSWLADLTGDPPCTPGVDCVDEDWYQSPGTPVVDVPALEAAAVLPAAPTCSDSTQNAEETDADCGGPICSACPDLSTCVEDSDCVSGSCDGGTCDEFLGSGTQADPWRSVPLATSCQAYEVDFTGLSTGSYLIEAEGTSRPVYCDFANGYEVHQQAVNKNLSDTRTFCTSRGLQLAIPAASEVGALVDTFVAADVGGKQRIRLDMDIRINGGCSSTLDGRSNSAAWRSVSAYRLPGNSQCSTTTHDWILGSQARVTAGGFYAAVGSGNEGGNDHRSWTRVCVQADGSGCNSWAAPDQGPFPVCSW